MNLISRVKHHFFPPKSPEEPQKVYSNLIKYTELVVYDDMKGDIKIVSQRDISYTEFYTLKSDSFFAYCPTIDENKLPTTRIIALKVVSPNIPIEVWKEGETTG